MTQLFRISIIIVTWFTILLGFAWLFNIDTTRINLCLYYSVSTCIILFGLNLLFGFRK
jgi:hypothetical protein